MRALITRPADDAAALAAAISARGIEPVIEPMLSVTPETNDRISLDGIQAILFSSANGVREFAKREKRRDLPVYAVGDASARAATAAGFTKVESAGRDAEALARLVSTKLRPGDGGLLHPRGRDTTGHLESALQDAGFELHSPVVYRAEAARALGPELRQMLADGAIDLALFFSPRTARTFAALISEADLAAPTHKITAVCLSQAVADELKPLTFNKVVVASAPNQEALLAALPNAPRPKRTRPAWAYVLATLVVVFIGLTVFYLMRPPDMRTPVGAPIVGAVAPPASDPRVAVLEQQLTQLRTEMESLSGAQAAAAAAQSQRIEAMERALAALDEKVTRLADTQSRSNGIAGAELLLATAQLRETIGRGSPYAGLLDAVGALGKGDAEAQDAVALLQDRARIGTPTAAQLAQRFDPVARAIVRAALAPEGSDWTARVWARLSALISWRRIGADVEGAAPDAIAARAEAKLDSGDLAGAVAELETLRGAPAEAARAWLADAKARLAADRALDALSAHALRLLGKAE